MKLIIFILILPFSTIFLLAILWIDYVRLAWEKFSVIYDKDKTPLL